MVLEKADNMSTNTFLMYSSPCSAEFFVLYKPQLASCLNIQDLHWD